MPFFNLYIIDMFKSIMWCIILVKLRGWGMTLDPAFFGALPVCGDLQISVMTTSYSDAVHLASSTNSWPVHYGGQWWKLIPTIYSSIVVYNTCTLL